MKRKEERIEEGEVKGDPLCLQREKWVHTPGPTGHTHTHTPKVSYLGPCARGHLAGSRG